MLPYYRTSVIMAVLAGVTWSSMGLAIRLIDAASTWQILLYRSTGMLLPLIVILYYRTSKNPLHAIRRSGPAGIVGAMGLVLAFAAAIFAIQTTNVANAVFLFSASPFIAAVLGFVVLRERIRTQTMVAIVIALAGIYIMVADDLNGGDMLGKGAALLSAFGFSVFAVSLRWGKQEDQLPTVLIGAVFSIFVAGAVIYGTGDTVVVSMKDFGLSFVMGFVILCGGMVLFTKASQNIPAAELSLLTMLEVVLGPVWVFVFLGETAQPATLVGGGIVGVALVLNSVGKAKQTVMGVDAKAG